MFPSLGVDPLIHVSSSLDGNSDRQVLAFTYASKHEAWWGTWHLKMPLYPSALTARVVTHWLAPVPSNASNRSWVWLVNSHCLSWPNDSNDVDYLTCPSCSKGSSCSSLLQVGIMWLYYLCQQRWLIPWLPAYGFPILLLMKQSITLPSLANVRHHWYHPWYSLQTLSDFQRCSRFIAIQWLSKCVGVHSLAWILTSIRQSELMFAKCHQQ